ncbi:SufS family cysteine desulfurase [Eubacterium sp. 1001713B170207_170306_E7]|uniref:aminotransferase class V-fold PLP-dependent enzyme n=1 Tax=Eubacterium sp. 1001713B170207_170306_E7 TaxID=2787097 RepID=UPI00189983B2|nr:SufS family cysteine desulfurase [Eubacterium sp. 1001713B170207_170306_E7]
MMKDERKQNLDWIRNSFPFLKNNPLVYLDNAATSQKPECVLQAEKNFYEQFNANPFRGLYSLAEKATEQYEEARCTVQHFIGASSSKEIVFTRNATESLNLVAYSWGAQTLQPGDEIVVSVMEHHSSLLPWQQAAQRTGAVIKYLECDPQGGIEEENLRRILTDQTKIVAVTHMSNIFGRINDLKRISQICHEKGAVVVADGAQSVPHIPVDVSALGVDFLAFSGHKMLAPMGIGVLYGKESLLEKMPPFLCGGEMIESVSRTEITLAPVPHKFEAGTVNAAGAVALAAAIRYIKDLGFKTIQERDEILTAMAMEAMQAIPGITILGSEHPGEHHGILTFTLEGVHPHDVAAVLDADHIAVRAGHHCAQPLLQYLSIPSATRASIAFYNTEAEIHQFTKSLGQIRRKMGYGE